MMLGPVARSLCAAGAGLAVLLAVMSARAVFEARAALAEASVALAAGDVDLAVVRLRSAARWYAPFNVYATRALVRLEQVGQRADALGEHDRALAAYRSIHAGIQATRGLYTPNRAALARADERIAALMAEEPPPKIDAQRSPEQRKADYLALLQAKDPSPFGVLLALAGFLTWVGSAAVFVSWGVDAKGRVLRGTARRTAVFLLLGWIAFAVGLRIA